MKRNPQGVGGRSGRRWWFSAQSMGVAFFLAWMMFIAGDGGRPSNSFFAETLRLMLWAAFGWIAASLFERAEMDKELAARSWLASHPGATTDEFLAAEKE